MKTEERQRWKRLAHEKVDRFVQGQVSSIMRQMGPSFTETPAERLEEIRANIKAKAHAYRRVLKDPPDDEQFPLYLEVVDEIIDDMKRVTVS